MGPAGHTAPQPPQWLTLELTSTQAPAHTRSPGAQESTQAPPLQLCPGAQVRPQAPQWAPLDVSEVSHPLAGLPSQSPQPRPHAPSAHTPLEQVADALAKEQARPHPPQLVVEALRWVSQPLAAAPSQLPKPVAHAPSAHAPPTHDDPALGNAHTPAQLPQRTGSVLRFASQPLAALPSQSAKPARQLAMPQRPATQAPAALAGAQASPQPPQLCPPARRSASQPLAAERSQSA